MTQTEEAKKWLREELERLRRAPDLNGCPMTQEWAEQIRVFTVALVAIEEKESNRIESDAVKGVEIDHFNWISFDERFPDDTMLEKAIIVCIKNRWNEQRVDTVRWHGNEQRLSNPWFWGDVTHWMPLPTPPKEEPT